MRLGGSGAPDRTGSTSGRGFPSLGAMAVSPASPAGTPSPRVLAVADTDSYLKWSLATLASLPTGWSSTQVVLDNPVAPSPAQRAAAGGGGLPLLRRRDLLQLIRRTRPDVVLLACTGPVVAALSGAAALRGPRRPVLVTGLPGISIPASRRAVTFRVGCDLFLLHSHREIAEFRALERSRSAHLRFGLARLPFLRGSLGAGGTDPVRARPAAGAEAPAAATSAAEAPAAEAPAAEAPGAGAPARTDVLFAAQAKVPVERAEREAILRALAATGHGVVKIRALETEQQTHHETWPYPDLLVDLVAGGEVAAGSVRMLGGAMGTALAQARALTTVSSTAALEAMDAGVEVCILSDFGVSAEMINLVFLGSGCLGTLDDVAAGRFRRPAPDWLRENYFHPAADDDWRGQLTDLVGVRSATGLPARPHASGSGPARVRRRLRLLVPSPALPVLRALQRRLPAAVDVRGPGRTARVRPRGPHDGSG